MRRYKGRARFVKKTIDVKSKDASPPSRPPAKMTDENTNPPMFSIPSHFCEEPPLQDDIISATSEAQRETIEECLPLLTTAQDSGVNPLDFNEFGIPSLRSEDHIDFLRGNLSQFPARFVGLDASRPWLVYWALMGLKFLGEDVEPMRRR